MTLFKYTLRDEKVVCGKCVRQNGYGISPNYSTMREVSLDEFINNREKMNQEKEKQVKDLTEFKADQNIEKCIFIDSEKKQFKIKGLFKGNIVYNLEDISSFDIVENGNIVASSGLGKAAIGGIAFGGFGAVVGAITGKKSKEMVNKLQIKINMKALNTPVVYIDLLPAPTKKGSVVYNATVRKADTILSSLDTILKEILSPIESNIEMNDLRKLKELLDEGILTQEEFDLKKKKILGI